MNTTTPESKDSTNTLQLPPLPSSEFPRKFLQNLKEKWQLEDLKPYLEKLSEPPQNSKEAFENWLRDYIELSNVCLEEGSRLYINMTCNTNDSEISNAYQNFVENIQPELEMFNDKARKIILGHPAAQQLEPKIYEKWLHSLKIQNEIFCEANIEIHTKISLLTQEYQSIQGSLMVEWEGKKKTLVQMANYLESPDRNIREKAWRAVQEKRFEVSEKLNGLFEKLYNYRNKIAENLKLKSFEEYSFKHYERLDYTPLDCEQYHQAILEIAVPLYKKIMEQRKKDLKVESLRPWDLSSDPFGRKSLKPVSDGFELKKKVGQIFKRMDEELAQYFFTMEKNQLLDLDNRMGKAPGGYQCSLDESRLPFIFMNGVGLHSDVMTLLHESGHAFHLFRCRHLDLAENRSAPTEFSEVASMSMERFGLHYLDEFYSQDEIKRARCQENEEVLRLLIWVAIVDKYQHWLYTSKNPAAEERTKYWVELNQSYNTGADWTNLEKYLEVSWQRQIHIFEVPFYYIEYGIAQLGALQFGRQFEQNQKEALRKYKEVLALGGSQGLKKLFQEAGLKFDFSADFLKPLLNDVYEQWKADYQ